MRQSEAPIEAPNEARIEALLGALALDEKAALMAGADLWNTTAVPRLGIGALRVTDGPSGARGTQWMGSATAACFPCGAALAASFDLRLVTRVGEALAAEARSKGARVLLAPTVNLARTPIGGRNFECYGEDPELAARTAVAFVRGVQSGGVGACVKHFVCNDVEWERRRASVEVSERALRELYLRPFEAAVHEAGALTVMAAYNRLGGTHCTEHERLLQGILRDEWGFDGVVISDWFATQSSAPSARAGMDLEMPGPASHYGAKLAEAVRAGDLSEAALDASVRRILRLLARTDRLEVAPGGPAPGEQAIDRPEHRALAREAAAAGAVLLRNEAGALPLGREIRKLALIGPNVDRAVIQGGGSARVPPHYAVTPLAGIHERAARAGVQVVFERGCANERGVPALDARRASTATNEAGLHLQCFASPEASGAPVLDQRVGAAELTWLSPPAPIERGAAWSARLRARITADTTGTHTLSLVSAGRSRLWLDGAERIDNWRPERGSSFFGLGSTERRAEVALEAGSQHELEVEFAHDGGRVTLGGLRVGLRPPEPADAMERAVAAAAAADAAVIVVGLDPDWEGEGRDRESFALPGRQDELVRRVAAANPRSVAVVNAGSPVAMDWADAPAAILQLWYPGQECGNALADLLFGDADPGGRLPITIPRRMQDTPAFLSVPGDGLRLVYDEDLFIGYRWYDARAIEPRFPFGHGLSYAAFEIGTPRLERASLAAGENAACTIDVENRSERAGSEVVQLYLRPLEPRVRGPVRALVGFEKVHLTPGEKRSLRLEIDARAFRTWDAEQGAWRFEPGAYELAAGRSSRALGPAVPLRIETPAA